MKVASQTINLMVYLLFVICVCVAETTDNSMSLWLSQDDSFTFYNSLIVVSVFILILYGVIITIVLVRQCYK